MDGGTFLLPKTGAPSRRPFIPSVVQHRLSIAPSPYSQLGTVTGNQAKPPITSYDTLSTTHGNGPTTGSMLAYADDLLSISAQHRRLGSHHRPSRKIWPCVQRQYQSSKDMFDFFVGSSAPHMASPLNQHIKWFDCDSETAFRYLGYPLTSHPTQLERSAHQLHLKIATHANMLKRRHISVLGSSLVVNFLLLSKLWHILRVTALPLQWLDRIRRTIVDFLLPLWPKRSWSTCYIPKRYGGLATVEPRLQKLALQMIYLQRLTAPPHPNDLTTPFLLALTKYYTGFTAPDQVFRNVEIFKKLTKKLPALQHLAKEIPKLLVSIPGWNISIPLRYLIHFQGISLKDFRTLQHSQS